MTDAQDYLFRVKCKACNAVGGEKYSAWFEDDGTARSWREEHFSERHPDDPLVKRNGIIQRYPADEVQA